MCGNNKKKDLVSKITFSVCFLIPMVIGIIGYLQAGESNFDSVYAAFTLYFVNPVSEKFNIWIGIAKWTAPFMMAATLVNIFLKYGKGVMKYVTAFFHKKHAVVVYTAEGTEILSDKNEKIIYSSDRCIPFVKDQIVMFDSDYDNFAFYEVNQKKLRKKNMIIVIKELEYGLLKEEKEIGENNNVVLYDYYGIIARKLWQGIKIWERYAVEENANPVITVVGDGVLAENVLNYGLLLNLYRLNQSITYNMLSESNLYQIKHHSLDVFNKDTIHYYCMSNPTSWEILEKSDYVIIAEELPIEKMQVVCARAKTAQIYYYSPEANGAKKRLCLGSLIPYGLKTEILTVSNIVRKNTIKRAMNMHHNYLCSHPEYLNGREIGKPEDEWMLLDGFLKLSNISVADFVPVIKYLADTHVKIQAKDSERHNTNHSDANCEKYGELPELEHIRWCRFHSINYWEYGDVTKKDKKARIHPDLTSYSNLEDAEKEKDIENIEVILKFNTEDL